MSFRIDALCAKTRPTNLPEDAESYHSTKFGCRISFCFFLSNMGDCINDTKIENTGNTSIRFS
jgi:hypothetical protein